MNLLSHTVDEEPQWAIYDPSKKAFYDKSPTCSITLQKLEDRIGDDPLAILKRHGWSLVRIKQKVEIIGVFEQ